MTHDTDQLPQADLDMITVGQCPACKVLGFRIGPQGGAAINIECVGCAARFNVVMFGGRCLMAQTIPGEVEGGAKWPTVEPGFAGHKGTFS